MGPEDRRQARQYKDMAEFSTYSSIPSTTGLGQGAAQVFAPQAIPLDTSSIQRGATAIGQGIAAEKEARAKAAEQKRKDDAKAAADAQAMAKGELPYYQSAYNEKMKEFNGFLNGEDVGMSAEEFQSQWVGEMNTLKAQEAVRVKELDALRKDEKAVVWDEETGMWIPAYTAAIGRYAREATDEEKELVKEGLFAQDDFVRSQEFLNTRIEKNPEFSLGKEVVDEYVRWKGGKGVDVSAMVSDTSDPDTQIRTIISKDSPAEQQAFKEHIKRNRDDLVEQYTRNKAIQGNVPPELMSAPFKENWKQNFDYDVEQVLLPSGLQVQKTLVKSGDGNGSGGTTELKTSIEGADNTEIIGDKAYAAISLPLGDAKVGGYDVVRLIKTSDKEGVVTVEKLDSGEVRETSRWDAKLAEGYKTNRKMASDKAEKSAVEKALKEFEESPIAEIDITAEREGLKNQMRKSNYDIDLFIDANKSKPDLALSEGAIEKIEAKESELKNPATREKAMNDIADIVLQENKALVMQGKEAKQSAKPSLQGEDLAAYNWAKSNPNDSRAKEILKTLGY